jgi:hypothetical protein
MGFVAPIINVDAASINFNGEQIEPVGKIANSSLPSGDLRIRSKASAKSESFCGRALVGCIVRRP